MRCAGSLTLTSCSVVDECWACTSSVASAEVRKRGRSSTKRQSRNFSPGCLSVDVKMQDLESESQSQVICATARTESQQSDVNEEAQRLIGKTVVLHTRNVRLQTVSRCRSVARK